MACLGGGRWCEGLSPSIILTGCFRSETAIARDNHQAGCQWWDPMRIRATNDSAAITGIYAGLLGLLAGPKVDASNLAYLVGAAAAFAVPAYFFVFGVRREDMVGTWYLQPALLKRVAVCIAGVAAVGAIAQIVLVLTSGLSLQR